jgi:hypothetical protein
MPVHRYLFEYVSHNMDARAFKALLHFMYTDTLPDGDEKVVVLAPQHSSSL